MNIQEAILEDNTTLQELQAECPMGVGLKVRNINAPDFFARSRAYEDRKIMVVRREGRIIGSGAVALKTIRLGGKDVLAGYDFQYFVSREGRREGVASGLLEWSAGHVRSRGGACAYCLIIDGNRPALGMVERAGFSVARTLTMAGLPIYKPYPVGANGIIRELGPDEFHAAAALIEETWSGHDFHERCDAASLRGFFSRTFGEGRGRFLVLEAGGELKACLGCWDWSRIMSVTVLSLSGKYRLMGAALAAGRRFASLPSIPKPGEKLNQWLITHTGFRDPESLGMLIRHMANDALKAGVGQIFGLHQASARMDAAYKGMFRVGTDMHLAVKPLSPECPAVFGNAHPAGFDL